MKRSGLILITITLALVTAGSASLLAYTYLKKHDNAAIQDVPIVSITTNVPAGTTPAFVSTVALDQMPADAEKLIQSTAMNLNIQKALVLLGMAIIFPSLVLLIFGAFEFGRAMYIKNTLIYAAREGARRA